MMSLNIALCLSVILVATDLSLGLSVNNFKGSDVLDTVPIIDGHNDLPYNIYSKYNNDLTKFHFENNLSNDSVWGSKVCRSCFTDLSRLREGKVGGQFWVAYVSCDSQYKDAVQLTMRQIDVIKRLVNRYPNDLQFVTEAKDIEDAWRNGKIASMIGVEGGHSIDSNLAILRLFYELGVRYLTLTHECNTPWADSSYVNDGSVRNLTEFGKTVVREMNRLGMLVDLSHVSHNVMRIVLSMTEAPVMFSHSSAFSVCDHYRNVPDDVLHMVKKNNGVVMVNFYSGFVNCNSSRAATIQDVIDHINYIRNLIGADHVGIGADYDGVSTMPEGLEDVSKYPDLFDRLYESPVEPRWTKEELEKVAGRNLIRVFKGVEAMLRITPRYFTDVSIRPRTVDINLPSNEARDALATETPYQTIIDTAEVSKAEESIGIKPGLCSTAMEWNINATTNN